MSTELLRRAAAKMRERAEATFHDNEPHDAWYGAHDIAVALGEIGSDTTTHRGDAEHIASWHPVVALAVADWLDAALTRDPRALGTEAESALTVARAYLKEDHRD